MTADSAAIELTVAPAALGGAGARLSPTPSVRPSVRRPDPPLPMPAARGPLSQALGRLLMGSPDASLDDPTLTWRGGADQAVSDDDLQLALWIAYEVDRRGVSGVDDGWRHRLPAVRAVWEEQLLSGLRHRLRTDRRFRGSAAPSGRLEGSQSPVTGSRRSALSRHLMCDASSRQFAEFLVQRSLHHLQDRAGRPPEVGGAEPPAVRLFRRLLQDWDLADRYGAYVDVVPGVSLLATNLASLFAALPARRYALAGYRAQTETTASEANSRYGWGHRRLGGGRSGAEFFDAHVVDDDPIPSAPVPTPVPASAPAPAAAPTPLSMSWRPGSGSPAGPAHADRQFGRRCALVADELFATHLLEAWSSGRTSLRQPLAWPLP